MSLDIKIQKKGYSWIEVHKVIDDGDKELIVPMEIRYKDIRSVSAMVDEPEYSDITLMNDRVVHVKDTINDILGAMDTIDRVHKAMV